MSSTGGATCTTPSDCPATGNVCTAATCIGGQCGTEDVPAGTPEGTQTAGDCHANECDGAGNLVPTVDDTDVPASTACGTGICTNGVPGQSPSKLGTTCSQGGVVCDGKGACVEAFSVVRIGADGSTTALSSAATAVFVETHLADGTLVGTPLALPTAASTSQQALTMSGSGTSEGLLTRSGDGHSLAVAGYGVIPGTAAVASTSGISHVIGRIGASGTIDTSTVLSGGAFSANAIRGAVSNDGTSFWVSGASGANVGGVWLVPFGGGAGTQILGQTGNLPNNARAIGIFAGQLYASASSGTYVNVFTVGAGLPTAQAVATSLPGMPTTSGPSSYQFAFFDLNAAVKGVDTLYVADDRTLASGGGIQKWTFDGTTWTLATTFTQGLTTGCRGVTGWISGTKVVLFATTTTTNANDIVTLTDDGSTTPTATKVATADANTVYRGLSLTAVP